MSFVDQAKLQYDELFCRANAAEKIFREHAWKEYSRMGLPDRKTETWKYSSLAPLLKTEWPLASGKSSPLQDVLRLRDKWRGHFEVVVVLDGNLRSDLSTYSGGKGVRIEPAVLSGEVEFEDGWVGLSVALAQPGFSLVLEDNAKPSRPLLLIQAQSSEAVWAPVVNAIQLRRGSSLDLASIFIGPRSKYLRSEITMVNLDHGAVMNWVRMQQDDQEAHHFSEVQAKLDSEAKLSLTQVNGGSAWCRSSLRSQIRGEQGEAHVNGLTFGRLHQHIDQRVEIRHSAGNTISSQLFKGVLKDFARGILNGKIAIERDAQKVSSSQLNHNLLLSRTCEADTKPELEIYADDVKANHGASIGRLDEDKMFYLMSRGITRAMAQEMLAHAFVADVLMKIEAPLLRRFADDSVREWLPEFMSEMEEAK